MDLRIQELEEQIVTLTRTQRGLQKELGKFRGLFDLAIAMTSDQSLDDILQLLVDQCRQLLQVDICYIALQDEERADFYKHTSSGIRTEAFRQLRLPFGMGLAGLVAKSGQGCMVEDYHAETALHEELRQIATAEGIVSGMAVPVQMASKILGMLYVFNRKQTAFSQFELETLSLIGNLAAVEISRKQAEEFLRESEERFRFMAETTGDVIYRLRYDSMSYDYLSPGINKLTGYSSEEINRLGFSKLVTRIDLPNQENVPPHVIVSDRLEGKIEEYRADYLVRTRSGVTRWLRDHSFPWFDETGKVIGSVGILSDISAYKRAEMLVQERTAELIASEEKYRTLVENVPLVVYRLKAGGEILFVNQFVEEVFGYTPVEILSNPGLWSETVYGEDRSRVEEQRERVYREGEELHTEYRVKHKQGYLVDVLDHAIPLPNSEGTVSIVEGIIMDISWMVRLHQQLVRAEGLKTISEVSARLAHEIRNPLVSAGGFARRLLSSMSPDDPNRSKVEIIVKEVARLEAILRMILNYLQPLELDFSPADLNDLVTRTLKGLNMVFERHGVHLNVQLASDLPEISLDQKLLVQVLEALLRNALEHVPMGSALTIRTSPGKDMLEVSMRYSDLHVCADDVEHFFYPFTTSGTAEEGLDLPMCKIIISKHGGAINVCLEPPRDLLIRISLPIQEDRPRNLHLPKK
jgi:PAS domain S-box-containing protein